MIAKYQNGNCTVTLEDDGTKIREYDGIPVPLFPESVDLKITDYCDLNCSYCHENSNTKGKHASVESIKWLIKDLVSKKTWDEQYMGDDGKFTMYVDAVNEKYAVSSINERIPLNGMNIREAFKRL